MFNLSDFLKHLPHHPGVYQMQDQSGKIIYIGKASDLKKRVTSYFSRQIHDLKTKALIKQIAKIDITLTNSATEAILLECHLIKKHQPRYNVLLRDDKSFPYILITKTDPYPRIDFFRGKCDKKQLYFGPYLNAQTVRGSIQWIQKIFQIRTCTNKQFSPRSRPCMLYQLKRCTAPCVGYVSKEKYAEQVQQAIWFLSGKDEKIKTDLEEKMQTCIDLLDFEQAAVYRDQLKRLRELQEKQYIVQAAHNTDVLAMVCLQNTTAIHLMAIRNGHVSASRTWFPAVPSQTEKDEILSSVISQYYFSFLQNQIFPKEILLSDSCHEMKNIQAALSQHAGFQVALLVPSRGYKKKWLELAKKNAKQALLMRYANQSQTEKRLQALQTVLRLDSLPHTIECMDISHHQGEAAVASVVVFKNGSASRALYRHFIVKNITAGDDPAAIAFALEKRLRHLLQQKKLPDIFLIDGGKLQLSRAEQICYQLKINLETMRLIGVAKGEGRKPGFETLFLARSGLSPAILKLEADHAALHLIQAIRDEAHRFAILQHRKKIRKNRLHSQLDCIKGIGKQRRNALIQYFGSIQAINHASLDEIAKVKGINRVFAERIFAVLHDDTNS